MRKNQEKTVKPLVLQMSEGSGQLKRGDLRAFDCLVEGLYPLGGEVRNTGVSEGFMGKME